MQTNKELEQYSRNLRKTKKPGAPTILKVCRVSDHKGTSKGL